MKITKAELTMLLHALRIGMEDGSLCNDDPKVEAVAHALVKKLERRREDFK